MSTPVAWLLLVVTSVLAGVALSFANVPAAALIGPMLASIALAVGTGMDIRLPRPLFTIAQGLVGCLIAMSITPALFAEVLRDWDAILLGVGVTIAASVVVGWLATRFGTLPGSTAAWGSSPGAASAMVALADEHGADARLVAAMQYVRVICVVLTASLVSRALISATGDPVMPATATSTHPHGLVDVAATLAIAIGGAALGRLCRVPAGGLLVPLMIGGAVNAFGIVALSPPPLLLPLAYAAIGWFIGLQFDRAAVRRAVRSMPEMAASSGATILVCGLAALAMSRVYPVTMLTAFLATSPGGIDTVAIIAVSGGADTAFVTASQTLRILTVVVLGPAIARVIARTATRGRGAATPH